MHLRQITVHKRKWEPIHVETGGTFSEEKNFDNYKVDDLVSILP